MNSEQRKTALITGATSGIGLELSRIMAEKGHPLVLIARNIDQLQRLIRDRQIMQKTSQFRILTSKT